MADGGNPDQGRKMDISLDATCPRTGEFCGYRANISKVRGAASIAAMEEHLYPEAAGAGISPIAERVFQGALDATDKTPCDERFCATLSYALVEGLMFRSLVESEIIDRAAQTQQPPEIS